MSELRKAIPNSQPSPSERAGKSAPAVLLDTHKQVDKPAIPLEVGGKPETLVSRGKRKKRSGAVAMRLASFDERRATRMERCSSRIVRRRCLSCGSEKFRAERCGDRLCPTCARARSGDMVKRYAPILEEYGAGKHAYFLTLTYRNSPHLRDRKLISRDVRALNRNKFWRQYGLEGGMYSVEVTWNKKHSEFHPHVHMLLFTREPMPCFVDERGVSRWDNDKVNQIVSDIWREVTGDSYIVKGLQFNGQYEELMKYVSKPDALIEMPDDAFEEFCRWLKGMRAVTRFGGAYGLPLPDEDEPTEEVCSCGCSVHEELTLDWDWRLGSYKPVKCVVTDCLTGEVIESVSGDSSPP